MKNIWKNIAVISTGLTLLACVPEGVQDTKEAQAIAKAIEEGKLPSGTTSSGGTLPTTTTGGTTTTTAPTTGGTTTTTTGTTSTGAAPLSSVVAFQQTVYPISRKYCVSCHIAQNQPFFASDDVVRAHDALINQNKVNFVDPAASRMVDRLLRDGHHCWSNCSADAQEMRNAIISWKDKMTVVATTTTTTTTPATTTASTRMSTIKVTVPATLPMGGDAAANFVTMSFTLNSATDTISPDIVGATFTMEIQRFDDFSYRMRNPRIITTTSAVSVKDIRVEVNGAYRINDATYSLVERAVATGATGSVLSTTPMVFLIDKGPGQDQLSISFGSLLKM